MKKGEKIEFYLLLAHVALDDVKEGGDYECVVLNIATVQWINQSDFDEHVAM